jgi:hypothetical protein
MHMNVDSRILKLLILAGLFIGVASGCSTPQPQWKRIFKEQIPITVQKDKPVQFQIRVQNESNSLGLQCAPETWQTLTNGGVDQITIQLMSSSKADTKIYFVRPGWLLSRPQSEGGGLLSAGFALFPNTQFLCGITGKRKGTATVQITFPDGPDEPTPAAIIVKKSDRKTIWAMLGF